MSVWMQLRASTSRTVLRAPLVWIRHLGLDPSDVFLASYPRSGNTLLRFPLAELIAGVPSGFDHIQRIVPEIGVHVHAHPLLRGSGRLIKTHERYRRQYRRAIYVVRDVRDVVLSAFARESAMGLLRIRHLDDYLEPFMLGKMSRWGSWQDHIEGWLNSPICASGDLLVLRFEDIRLRLAPALERSLAFLGMSSSPDAIQHACANNSIESMRAKERQSKTLPKSETEDGWLVGSGNIEGWRSQLNPQQLALIEQYAGATLTQLGYGVGSEQRCQDSMLPGAVFPTLYAS